MQKVWTCRIWKGDWIDRDSFGLSAQDLPVAKFLKLTENNTYRPPIGNVLSVHDPVTMVIWNSNNHKHSHPHAYFGGAFKEHLLLDSSTFKRPCQENLDLVNSQECLGHQESLVPLEDPFLLVYQCLRQGQEVP